FEEHRFAYMGLLAAVVGRARLVSEQSFVWTAVTQADLAEHWVTMEEVEGLIDVVRRTKEADVSAVLKEDPDGSVRVSMRSRGAVDVCAVAQRFGGGGHRFAAGFTNKGPIAEVVDTIR